MLYLYALHKKSPVGEIDKKYNCTLRNSKVFRHAVRIEPRQHPDTAKTALRQPSETQTQWGTPRHTKGRKGDGTARGNECKGKIEASVLSWSRGETHARQSGASDRNSAISMRKGQGSRNQWDVNDSEGASHTSVPSDVGRG